MTGLSVRGPVLLGLAALGILVFGFGLWSVTARLSGAIVAEGRIEVERNRQIVQHPDGGLVAEILVREGDSVVAGEVLVRLDGAALISELAIVEGRLTEDLARTARLLAERDGADAPAYPPDLAARALHSADIAAQIDGQTRLFHARRATLARMSQQLRRRIAQSHAELRGIAALQAALARQAALVATELANQQRLFAKGLTPSASVLALLREAARLDGQLGEADAARAQSLGLITEIEAQISGLATQRREEAAADLREIGPAVLELAERARALSQRIARLDLRAPVAGVVLGLAVTTPRAVLRAADPVLYLVPQDRPLVISAEIAPADIDEVRPGQPVDLIASAFSGDADSPLTGRVVVVSADALAAPDSGAAFYRAEIRLDPGQTDRLGDRRLLPGMPVTVYVQTGARTPLAYLVAPFTAYFARALRES